MRDGKLSRLVATPNVSDQRHNVDGTVRSLDALNANTTHVHITIDGEPARVTYDGSDPTAANGHLWERGKSDTLTKVLASTMKWRRQTGAGTGTLQATEMTF